MAKAKGKDLDVLLMGSAGKSFWSTECCCTVSYLVWHHRREIGRPKNQARDTIAADADRGEVAANEDGSNTTTSKESGQCFSKEDARQQIACEINEIQRDKNAEFRCESTTRRSPEPHRRQYTC